MSRGAQTFKQNDVKKAGKGALDAGLDVQRIEIDRAGKIVIIVGKPASPHSAKQQLKMFRG
jgi:hypothetical protein